MNVETFNVPRAGQLHVDIHLTAQVNVTAAVARRKVNVFLATNVGNLLLAAEPALTLAQRIVWRVPVDLTSPTRGRFGRVAEIDVDVESGELLITQEQIEAISKNANDFVVGPLSS